MKRTRFVFLPPVFTDPATFIVRADDGTLLERGRLSCSDAMMPARDVLVIPGTDVLTCWLELPESSPAKMIAAANLALKSEIAVSADRLHIAIGAAGPDGVRPVCIVDRAILASYLDRATALGIVPDFVVPTHMLLPGAEDHTIHAGILGSLVIMRGRNIAFTCEPELGWLLVGSQPIRAIEGDVEHILATSTMADGIDLLPRDFARKRKGAITLRSFKRAACLAAMLLLSPLALWSAEIVSARLEAHALALRAETAARTLNGAAESGDPVAYTRRLLSDMKAYDRYLLATSVLFHAIENSDGLALDSYAFRSDGLIRATIIPAGAAEIEKLVPILEQAGFSTVQEQAADRNGQAATALFLRLLP